MYYFTKIGDRLEIISPYEQTGFYRDIGSPDAQAKTENRHSFIFDMSKQLSLLFGVR